MNTPPLHRRRLLQALLLPAAAALAGCATTASPEADRAALLQRAREYWALVQQNDKLKAWSYEAASKDPNAKFEGYAKRGGIIFDAVEVQGIQSMDGGKALVTVHQRYNLPLLRLKDLQATLQDHWQWIDGQWYHHVPPSVAFPSAAPEEK